jgi:hypothetical protein
MNDQSVAINAFLLKLGAQPLSAFEASKFSDYLAEDDLRKNSLLGELFLLFKKVMQESNILSGLQKCFTSTPPSDDEHLKYSAFTDDFKRFDQLSNYYGNQYRGSFIFIYLIGALAVLAALIPVGFAFEDSFGHDAHLYSLFVTAVELLMILTILIVNKVGANPHGDHVGKPLLGFKLNRRWHQRWIEYRILAERFRYLEILYPIGINPVKDGSVKNDTDEWINAYFVMRVSAVNFETTNDDVGYRKRLLEIMKGQSNYHHKAAHRSENIHHRLHTFATWLFYGTLIACASHFIFHNPILTLASGFLPALAAAMHGILANGEFSKAVDVSEHMHEQMNELINKLNSSTCETEVRDVAIEFHNIVIGEALSWRAMFKDKNVPLA